MTFPELDMKNNFCLCEKGKSNANCKHKIAVSKFYGVAELAVLPVHDMSAQQDISLWHYMAHGKTMESSFYRPLNQPEASANIEEYVESHKSAPAGIDTGDAPAAPDVVTSHFQ